MLAASQTLAEEHGVSSDVYSVTSFKELYRDAQETERWNTLHPEAGERRPYVATCLGEGDAPVIAARLVTLLPKGTVADIPQTKEARVASLEAAVRSGRASQKAKKGATGTTMRASIGKPKAGYATWLMWGAIALGFYFLVVQLTPTRNLESDGRETQQGS